MNEQTLIAIVTGSSTGIGLDIAKAFLNQSGNLVLNGRDPEKLASAAAKLGATDRVTTVSGDIGKRETGEALVQTALARFGRVDILVNNAGTFASKPFIDVTEDELDGYLNGNLRGTYLTTQAVVRQTHG
jgi:NAD(P)-dependent dehydrogenase (short-subunit alcohol dehydrogenase family)